MSAVLEPWYVLVTAEHGGNRVPKEYQELFRGHQSLLDSHRGWDPGTLGVARGLARWLDAPLLHSRVTRLLVDLNRSAHHPRVFSEVTRPLSLGERLELLERYHRPHRDAVAREVADAASAGRRVLHLAVHSFTAVLGGVARKPDLSLLYDPRATAERALVGHWVAALRSALPTRTIRRNDPYRGNADGLTTTLRARFTGEQYLGIEIEVNQRHLIERSRFPAWVAGTLIGSLVGALRSL